MKRVPAYQRDIYKVATVTLLVVLAINLIHRQMQAWAAWADPRSTRDVIVMEREVEKLVEVPRLPSDVEEYIRAVFGSESSNALKVFRCESGLREKAYNKNANGSIDVGIAQINSVHGVPKRYLENYKINILVAKQIYDSRGNWSAWVCASKLGIK